LIDYFARIVFTEQSRLRKNITDWRESRSVIRRSLRLRSGNSYYV